MTSGFDILGGEQSGPDGPQASFRVVSPGYFAALGIPVIEGRAFTDDDRVGRPLVVIVNAELANRYFADDALGKHIGYRLDADGNRIFAEIVGIAGNVHHFGPGLPPVPEIYEPLGQAEETFRWFGRSVAVIARTVGPIEPLGAAIREVLRAADPNLPVYQIQPLDDFLARSTTTPRFHARLLGLFGALATLLAAVGVYGVLSLNVRMRVREIGLRQALGADRRDVVRTVVSRGLGLAVVGSAAGLLAAVVLARYVESLLFEVGRTDLVTLVAAPLLLAAIATLACWVPARRAARIDPVVALRNL